MDRLSRLSCHIVFFLKIQSLMFEIFLHSKSFSIQLFLSFFFITGRNEVVGKVIFLQLSVILFTGGGVSSRETSPCQGEPPPPATRENSPPPPPGRTPPARENPPPLPGRTPPARENPPCQGEPPPPPRKQTAAYGQRAAGTHPTGMHSCLLNVTYKC